MKKILFVASEGVPFIKTGGLADVVGSLPKCIDKEYFDVRVILPKYTCMKQEMKDKLSYVTHFYMDFHWKNEYVGVLYAEVDGVKYYFIDNEMFFNGFKPYSDNALFEIEKFAFFSKAALSILPVIDFRPDVIHCHDWQTGLIPVYIKDSFNDNPFYHGIKTIMTIHNLKFQGIWDKQKVIDITGLNEYYFTSDKLEAYGDANYLKGGIVYADMVTTVSDSYAEEIKMPFYGEHLDGLMRARSNCLRGIVNGLDYDEYNPETDPLIYANYNAKTVIDLSEIINIYKHDSNNVLFVFCFSYKIGKKTYKIVSVVQSCQNIVICHIGQFIVLILYLGNIFKTDDLIHRYIHLIIDHGNLTLNPGFSVLQSYDRTVRLYSRFFEEEKLLKRKNIFFFYFPVNLADILDLPDLHTFKKIVPVGYCLHIMIFKIDIYKSTSRCLTDQFQHFFFFFKLLIQGVQ